MGASSDPSPEVEVEWQLDALDLRPVERFLGSGSPMSPATAGVSGMAVSPLPARRLVDEYMDTADWRLGRAGYVLRIRRRAGRSEVTMKNLADATDGLRRRLEVTQPLPPGGMASIDSSGPVGWRLRALCGSRPLQRVLEVRTHRRPFNLTVDGQLMAEIALDETAISVGGERRRLRLQRVEVEVKPSFVSTAQPLVERLRLECGLQPAALSKFEVGLLGAGLTIPGVPDLGDARVDASSTLGDVAYGALRRDVRAMIDHEAGTRLGEDIEELHQMRVATRRMRAALGLFGDVLPARAVRLRSELGWLASILGAVRDLDVQLDRLGVWREELPAHLGQALDEVTGLLIDHRNVAQSQLLEALESRRYERLVSGLASMVQAGPSRRLVASRTAGAVAVPELITARHRSAAKAARRARRSGDPTEYHELRIRCKKLRYALEFASPIYDGQLKAVAREMSKLQDELGLMQDAEVATQWLESLATSDEGESLSRATIFAMGGLAERHRRDAERRLTALPGLLRLLEGPAWRRARRLMDRTRDEAIAEQERERARSTLAMPSRRGVTPNGEADRRPGSADGIVSLELIEGTQTSESAQGSSATLLGAPGPEVLGELGHPSRIPAGRPGQPRLRRRVGPARPPRPGVPDSPGTSPDGPPGTSPDGSPGPSPDGPPDPSPGGSPGPSPNGSPGSLPGPSPGDSSDTASDPGEAPGLAGPSESGTPNGSHSAELSEIGPTRLLRGLSPT